MMYRDYKITKIGKHLYNYWKNSTGIDVTFDLEKMTASWKEQLFVQGERIDEMVTWYFSRSHNAWFYRKSLHSRDTNILSEHDSDLLDYLVNHHLNEEIVR